MRLLFFGMRCTFSPPVLSTLIAAGHELAAIVLPGVHGGESWRVTRSSGRPGLPMAGPPSLDALAATHGIAIAQASNLRDSAATDAIAAIQPDLIVVACFPRLIPPEIFGIARYGGLNLHPSLLPAFRGPAPLFWTLRSGLRESGVTAHQLSDRFDAGSIYAQSPLTIPFGERLQTIEHAFASAAAELAVETIAAIAQGANASINQNDTLATAAPFPTDDDFVMHDSWSADRAFAFARAVAPMGGSLTVSLANGRKMPVADAETWSDGIEPLPADRASCDSLWVRFVNGYVRFSRR